MDELSETEGAMLGINSTRKGNRFEFFMLKFNEVLGWFSSIICSFSQKNAPKIES